MRTVKILAAPLFVATAALAALGSAAESENPERRGLGIQPTAIGRESTGLPIDARKSLFVTDLDIVVGFTFERTMTKLVETAPGNAGKSKAELKNAALSLFRQWWDSANDRSNGHTPSAIKCDALEKPGGKTLNGFPYQCPRSEGDLATADPFDAAKQPLFFPIAVVNRLDLSSDASTCGEHRIVYAKADNAGGRNLVIFEANLPNPSPEMGSLGCQPVARFWQSLTMVKDPGERAKRLEGFFYDGLPGGGGRPGFEPVIHFRHLGADEKGQIRTNQFMDATWLLREFKLVENDGSAIIKPVTVKVNPWGLLFSRFFGTTAAKKELQSKFEKDFVGQVTAKKLAADDINLFNMATDAAFDGGDSDEQKDDEHDYASIAHPMIVDQATGKEHFDENRGNGRLVTAILNRLALLRSKGEPIAEQLTPHHVIKRALANSCAGCHQFSVEADIGLTSGKPFPGKSQFFTHVTEENPEDIPGEPGRKRFVISEALDQVFLKWRAEKLDELLALKPK